MPITIAKDAAGTVRGIVIDNLHGTAEVPLVIDGHNAIVDGLGKSNTLWVHDCSYLILKRWSLCNSLSRQSTCDGSSHITFDRCLSWEAADGNCMPWTITNSPFTTLIDCAGWGRGRKIFQVYAGSNDCAFRCCWGRWGGMTTPSFGSSGVYAPAYNSFRCRMTDCIGQSVKDSQQLVNAIWIADRMDGPNAGKPAECVVDHCLALSGYQEEAFHTGSTPPNSVTYRRCIDATFGKENTVDWQLLWMLRETWKQSPILDRLKTLAQADPVADIEQVLRMSCTDDTLFPVTT